MTIQKVNIGSVVNDGTGDDLRTAFVKANNNFDQLANTINIVNSNDLLVRYMYEVLNNYDFGTFTGTDTTNISILQLILQTLDLDFGTITSPGRYDLDLGSIVPNNDFMTSYVKDIDGGTA
jgi:hypothetical protein